ncbi:MAG: A/G-specific adenine glycosylase [Bacteroidales bacterium]|nr:A/G-specific adenine glycosylase [Bacteroidales bacterium]
MKISAILQSWYDANLRPLPWRETTDAYAIWLSEIILQQTRVAQGLEYYLRFINTYPTVDKLAAASEDDILKLWQGLGYYSRARNLHKAAQKVMSDYNGVFPQHYANLIKLPGVGPYTASAIASFSSGEAVATVDGNVYRVLSRLFDIDTPIDSTTGQKLFAQLAQQELDPTHAGKHNQAIMEFGALQCTPTSPNCIDCPLTDHCLALEHHTQTLRPVKAGKVKVRERKLHYYIYIFKDTLWVHQRGAGDIWQGLWEFYCIEETASLKNKNLAGSKAEPLMQFSLKHQLTHQTLLCSFSVFVLEQPIDLSNEGYCCLSWKEWLQKAAPKPIFEINKKIAPLFEQP